MVSEATAMADSDISLNTAFVFNIDNALEKIKIQAFGKLNYNDSCTLQYAELLLLPSFFD